MLFLLNIYLLSINQVVGEDVDDDYVIFLPEKEDSNGDDAVGSDGVRQFVDNVETAKNPNLYKFVVSVIVNNNNMCVGLYVKPTITLTAFCFFDDKITKLNKVKVATWESTETNGKGEIKNIVDMHVHPNFDATTCNYDVVLLKMENPFTSHKAEIIQLKRKVTLPRPGQTCLVVAPFNGVILIKQLSPNKLEMCKGHIEYNRFDTCDQRKNLICLGIKEGVYGAPVICDNSVVGVLPTNIDFDQNFTVVQFLPTYYQWIQNIVGSTRRSSSSNSFNKKGYILYYYSILVIMI